MSIKNNRTRLETAKRILENGLTRMRATMTDSSRPHLEPNYYFYTRKQRELEVVTAKLLRRGK
jgi:hypothetical protein